MNNILAALCDILPHCISVNSFNDNDDAKSGVTHVRATPTSPKRKKTGREITFLASLWVEGAVVCFWDRLCTLLIYV